MKGIERFGLSPLIRFTLLSLYGALVLPLPLLAPDESRWLMVAGLLLGLVLVIGLLSERVETDAEGIQVRYPVWIRWLLRRGWAMRWQDIRAWFPSVPVRGELCITSRQPIYAISCCRNASSALIDFWSFWRPTPMCRLRASGV